MAAAVLAATPVLAQQNYAGSVSSGQNQLGSTRCPTYAMKMDLTVNGSDIKATFQQAGRDQRNFAATAKPDGTFVTEAIVGGGNRMRVTGKVTPGLVTVKLDGYCIFDFKLAPVR
ncbi:MAG: hypothetical protein KF889_14290 [Alphaproteobacteria bacterium]|nr:hypothetical protein [Alphaproteobacteria bacterium]MCW5738832.1 hypothetical protein [Alphaproteobacteria bacterium]